MNSEKLWKSIKSLLKKTNREMFELPIIISNQKISHLPYQKNMARVYFERNNGCLNIFTEKPLQYKLIINNKNTNEILLFIRKLLLEEYLTGKTKELFKKETLILN